MNWSNRILIAAGLIFTTHASALDFGDRRDLHILSLDSFAMEDYKIIDNRDPYFPFANAPSDQEHWTQGIAALMNVDLVNYDLYSAYWRGCVFGNATDRQFREIGLQYEMGFEIRNYFNVFWQHESDHGLDYQPAFERFPLRNYVGVRITFYKRDR
jgi:hypothetical protein